MTDLEMTRLCAEAMGVKLINEICRGEERYRPDNLYDPLHDDAQAMALVKKLNMEIERSDAGRCKAWIHPAKEHSEWCDNLNLAIVECVAKMQAAK